MKSTDFTVFVTHPERLSDGPAMPAPTRVAEPVERRAFGLTARQAEVLECMLQGLPNKLISRQLGIAHGTVKIHVSAILRALRVRNRTQAVVTAGRLGFTFDRAFDGSAGGAAQSMRGRT